MASSLQHVVKNNPAKLHAVTMEHENRIMKFTK